MKAGTMAQRKHSQIRKFQPEPSPSERIAQVIFEHAARISRQKDIPAMANLNADLARDLLGADRCSLWLIDHNTHELYTRVAHGVSEIRIQQGAGIVGDSVAQGQPILVNDVRSHRNFLGKVDDASGYETHCVLTVPLWVDGQVIGAIQALNKPGGFTAEDAELLRFMAMYTAAAIQAERLRREAEAAMLLRRELDIAADVQRQLLPHEDVEVAGLEIATFCRPARMVGGDFYDLLAIGEQRLGFTLGDVAGKGFPAAVMMASIQTLLRRLLLHDPENPAQVMAELNEAIHDSSTPDRYATLFCGILNAARNELLYVNAGHIQPMIVRGNDGSLVRPQGGDLPAGLLPGVHFSQHREKVFSEDIIACISDGIAEAHNQAGEPCEDSLVEQILCSKRHLPIEQLSAEIVDAIDAYAGGAEQHDDMTLVLIRICN
jgi:sigma-B regulation protein RsbU (phosphoserine phosphatase)